MPGRSTVFGIARAALGLIGIALRRSTVVAIARDALGLIGIALIVYGVSLVFLPAGYIAAGAFALACCVLLSRNAR